MEPINRVISKSVFLNRDHLDNNDIMPSFFARKTTKKGSAEYLFNNLRYLPGLPKKPDLNFPLNQPESEEAQILIPGKFFAAEIEHEQAVWAILDAGFKVVISNEFGHAFKKNSLRNGLLPIELAAHELEELAHFKGRMSVDLPNQDIHIPGKLYFFEIDQDYKLKLMHGLDTVQETLGSFEEKLSAYEERWNSFYV